MTTPTVIYRYEVPVDGGVHEHRCGPPLYVSSRQPDVVEFWAHPDGLGVYPRRFIVVGTGQPLPEEKTVYRGSTTTGGGSLVWHLLEFTS
jgi:hypothetical protein